MEQIKAFAFDMDGTLIDAGPWHHEAFNKALSMYNVPPITREDHLRTFNGLSTKRKLEMLVAAGKLDACFVDQVNKLKQMHTEEMIKQRCRPSTHILDVVTWCKSRGPIIMVTNCSYDTTMQMVELAGLKELFGANIITSRDTYGHIKPSPMPYKIAQTVLGVKPKELLAIEDTDKGAISAIESGSRLWKISSHEELTILNLESVLRDYERSMRDD